MKFHELKEFIIEKMRLSHIYQPLLIKTLVELGGSATIRQLAITFLQNDESQLLYYEKRLKEMPIKVLSKHNVIKRDGDLITLETQKLTLEQKAEIKKLCEQKMQEYIESRGLSIWDYRLLDNDPIPDSLRYRVLKEAKGRCALCGATKDTALLDIDHIIPRSRGGKTEYSNLQVLCAKCNRSKGNKDKTDFREITCKEFNENCVFCRKSKSNEVILENDYAFALLDGYPVTEGHTLIIPKRHFSDYFETTIVELNAANDLLRIRQKDLRDYDHLITGFNVGANVNEAAGQSVFHMHIHLIPRRKGDLPNPKGGVRGVIPNKMKY